MMIAWTIETLTALGALLCLWSVLRFRPTRFTPAPVVAVVGWEIVACLLLARSAIQLVWTHGGVYTHDHASSWSSLFGVVSIVIVDALIIWRIVIFQRFTQDFKEESERLEAT